MTVSSVVELVDLLRAKNLLPPTQLQLIATDLPAEYPDARAAAEMLVRRKWLTSYQVEQVFDHDAQNLVLGPYVLLEPLGEGGMGQVFKARHSMLDRIVALKLIREERMNRDPEAVRRFQREARAVAQLAHPNIVMVYDMGQAEGTYFIAMEYAEGTDLAHWVQESGPLPVARACDFIRQAALGLQHAHEQGMVHRDIKPSNLLLASGGHKPPVSEPVSVSETGGLRPPLASGVIKILDLGLARLCSLQPDETAHSLTDTGAVVGTADFIAPEQARNARDVDIRADLYSLGCTLYFLLAGKAPFPGETLTEKLLKHQLDEPRPLEVLRHEVPPGVLAIVRKLMAKRPEDRYQTPAEVAVALKPYCPAEELPSARAEEHVKPVPGIASRPTPPPPLAVPVFADSLPAAVESGGTAPLPNRFRLPERRRWSIVLAIVAGVVLLSASAAGGLWWLVGRRPPPVATRVAPSTASGGVQQAKAHFDRGVALMDQKLTDQAIAEFNEAIRLDPQLAAAYSNRGLLLRTKGQLDQAIDDFSRAVQLNPKFTAAYFNRAAAYYDKRDYQKCLEDNNRVIELNPRDATAYNNRGTIYSLRRQIDRAIADFTVAIQINPGYLSAYNNRGNAYIDKNELDEALKDFNLAIKLDAGNAASFSYRGYTWFLKGELDKAMADLDRAIELNSNYALAYLHRSEAHRKKGNIKQADADYREAIRLDRNLAKGGNGGVP
jgi:serine/threonine-protein kinase